MPIPVSRTDTRLLEKKSLARVVHHFRRHDLSVPRRDRYGAIHWKRPTIASLGSMVKNTAYAGAFVYGRTRSIRAENTGKSQQRLLPPNQWRFVVRDRYPAYISWQTYERIRQMLRDNHAEYDRNKTRGVPRDGQALLHGIVYVDSLYADKSSGSDFPACWHRKKITVEVEAKAREVAVLKLLAGLKKFDAKWFVYIMRYSDGSLYTGITNDVSRRCEQHNAGTASRYTRSRLPVALVYQEAQTSRSLALKRELAIKALSRRERESLIRLAG